MLLLLLLNTSLLAAEAPPRLLGPELTGGVGVLGSAYTQGSTRWGDAHLAPIVTGRALFGGFTVEAGLLVAAPLSAETTATSVTTGLDVGWTGQRWNVTLGATLQWGVGTTPALQLLPHLRGSFDFGPFGLTLGLLDQLALVPAQLSGFFRLGPTRVTVGYVVPLGALAGVDLPLRGGVGLRVTGFAFKLAQSEFAMLTLAATFDGGAR